MFNTLKTLWIISTLFGISLILFACIIIYVDDQLSTYCKPTAARNETNLRESFNGDVLRYFFPQIVWWVHVVCVLIGIVLFCISVIPTLARVIVPNRKWHTLNSCNLICGFIHWFTLTYIVCAVDIYFSGFWLSITGSLINAVCWIVIICNSTKTYASTSQSANDSGCDTASA